MRALAAIVETYPEMSPRETFGCGLFDYYDHWTSVDERIGIYREKLSRASDILANDLFNSATYVNEILGWLPPERMKNRGSVVCVSAMTEGIFFALRSAYDAVAMALALIVSDNLGQVPKDSLRALAKWTKNNPQRADTRVIDCIDRELDEFWSLRTLRDHIAHNGAHANIHCDSRQFNLWLYGPNGWIIREPLLSRHIDALIRFANEAAKVINNSINLPKDRIGSRVIEGIFVEALHKLFEIQTSYAEPSP